eukprot:5050457-Karenia_brevis.AAC.1
MTEGNVKVAVDSAYVCKGYARGPHWAHRYHEEEWAALWTAIQHRTGELQLVKIKSHQTEVDLQRSTPELWALLANEVADGLAEEAAKEYQFPEHVVKDMHSADWQNEQIMRRL